MNNKNWYEETQELFFIKIDDTETLDRAITILEDRKEILETNLDLQQEIYRLNNIISETSKDIQHELSHLKANDEVSWNEEFYTNNKLDYRKLCIALLEQVVNKLKEKE